MKPSSGAANQEQQEIANLHNRRHQKQADRFSQGHIVIQTLAELKKPQLSQS